MGEGPGNDALAPRRKRARVRAYVAIGATVVLGASAAVGVTAATASTAGLTVASVPVPKTAPAGWYRHGPRTATPIKHVVVLFGENVSFDHYFGSYPKATNENGSRFSPKRGTPHVNGLTPALLSNNPNEFNPKRLSPAQALTCDQNHGYTPEQKAEDNGKMDMFQQNTSVDTCTGQPIEFGEPGLGMDYYDGNTVTALWNYAQNYAMSDNNFDTVFGPSTPGALNLIAGNTGAAEPVDPTTGQFAPSTGVGSVDSQHLGTVFGDPDPAFDACSDSSHTSTSPVVSMAGKNIGDLLNVKHITWGWFQGGFAPTGKTTAGVTLCGKSHENIGGAAVPDYSPHHSPFEYYKSTANPNHLPPSSEQWIGRTDQANHNYDLTDFYKTLTHGNMPSVSFLKAGEYQDGHAGYSDPIDEQHFIVKTVNAIEKSRFWRSTAIVVTYDDSDGWYDHQPSPIVNGSNDPTLDATICSAKPVGLGGRNDRCGYGPRLPLLVISPYTRENSVSHNLTDQSSIINFIEDNWLHGQRLGNGSFDAMAGSLDGRGGLLNFHGFPHVRPVILSPATGKVVKPRHHHHR